MPTQSEMLRQCAYNELVNTWVINDTSNWLGAGGGVGSGGH